MNTQSAIIQKESHRRNLTLPSVAQTGPGSLASYDKDGIQVRTLRGGHVYRIN